MADHARIDATTADPDAIEDRSMRLLEWTLAGVALLAAVALTLAR